jgi:hypothetical protein
MTGRIGAMYCLGLAGEREKHEVLIEGTWKKGYLRGGVRS